MADTRSSTSGVFPRTDEFPGDRTLSTTMKSPFLGMAPVRSGFGESRSKSRQKRDSTFSLHGHTKHVGSLFWIAADEHTAGCDPAASKCSSQSKMKFWPEN